MTTYESTMASKKPSPPSLHMKHYTETMTSKQPSATHTSFVSSSLLQPKPKPKPKSKAQLQLQLQTSPSEDLISATEVPQLAVPSGGYKFTTLSTQGWRTHFPLMSEPCSTHSQAIISKLEQYQTLLRTR